MGVAICCLNTFNKDIKNEKKIIFKPSPEQINKIEKIVKLQKNIRKFLSVLKFQIYFNEAKTKVINELDQKKLMNQNNVTECESEKFYQKLISKEKIQEFTKNNNFNKFYSNLSKYSFSIPYYIVTSPIEVYKGSWNLNKRYHGYGIKFEFDLKQNRNKRTEGIFFDGFLTGQGLVITSEGEIFMGNFIRNKLDGEGEHYRKDNSIYKGEFKNGKYDGLGKEIFNDDNNSKNSSIFEGFYQDGEKKYGKFEWSNGCQYQGNFLKIFSMEKENIIGMSINIMMEPGIKEKLMETENLCIMMEAFMKENLLKEKNLEKVNMFGMKINTMMGIGRMISKMDMAFIIIMEKLLKDIG